MSEEVLDYSQFADDVNWRGVMAVLNTADAAGRKIVQKGTMPLARKLPLSLRYKPADWPGHNGAVNVGSIDKVWLEGNKLWGQGRFDFADRSALDVVRKVRNGFVRHMSADIEPGTYKLMATTVLDVPAFEDAQFTAINVPEQVIQESQEVAPPEDRLVPFSFRVVGDMDLPLASREREWDSAAAKTRVAAWAGGDDLDPAKYRRAFLYQDEDSDPSLKGSYKLPFADVIDGELTAVPRGLFAVAGVLEGARGGVDIPQSDQDTIRRRVSAWYKKMASEFDDPGLRAPWDGSQTNDADDREAYNLEALVVRQRYAYAVLDHG